MCLSLFVSLKVCVSSVSTVKSPKICGYGHAILPMSTTNQWRGKKERKKKLENTLITEQTIQIDETENKRWK